MTFSATERPSPILLFGKDERLVETRRWVLEKAGFCVHTTLSLDELGQIAAREPISLFVLCDSLRPEERSGALSLLRSGWPEARRLLVASPGSHAMIDPAEDVFSAVEGPASLVATVRALMALSQGA